MAQTSDKSCREIDAQAGANLMKTFSDFLAEGNVSIANLKVTPTRKGRADKENDAIDGQSVYEEKGLGMVPADKKPEKI
jgi:hypothetical protein